MKWVEIDKSGGWIKLYRKIKNNPIYENRNYMSVWLDLLLSANHRETSFIWNGEKITLQPGQLLTSQLKMSKNLKMSIGEIAKILKYLENENQIRKQSTNRFTIITIVTWAQYNASGETKSENTVKTERKQRETYKNEEKVKENDIEITTEDVDFVLREGKKILDIPEYDGYEDKNRQFARRCIERFGRDNVLKILKRAHESTFWTNKVTSFELVFKHGIKIYKSIQEGGDSK